MSWQDAYASPLQSVWGLTVGPALFLLWMVCAPCPLRLGADPAARGFVRAWAAVFALVAIADATLPALAGVPMLLFVLLGDFRVFLLVEAVSRPQRPLRRHLLVAAAWTAVVPAITAVVYPALLAWRGPLPGPLLTVLADAATSQALWLCYELAFAVLAVLLRGLVVPRRRPPACRYLRAVLGWVVAYYLLWAAADVLILVGDDRGWLLRMVPNQLYYGLFVPVAYGLFFAYSPAARASTRSRDQAAR